MKLKHISCTQFAGIHDKDVSLEDGINVICGKNESGKSTMVNLLSRTLFQKAKLDGRSDKEFIRLYFPSPKKGGVVYDNFADGSVTFETEQGTYTLKKEWGSDSRVTLRTPDGILRDGKKIDELMHTVLSYGEGVYSDMLLTSQHNTDRVLENLLDAAADSDAKKEITAAASKAFAESDGVSMDDVEAAIEAKISAITGKHWDEEAGAPKRKADRWKKDLGDILTDYYAMEDAQEVLNRIRDLQADADAAAIRYKDAEKRAADAENEAAEFRLCADCLRQEKERREKRERLMENQKRYKSALERWPRLESAVQDARNLDGEKTSRETADQYSKAQQAAQELARVDQSLLNRECPGENEIKAVVAAEKEITRLENKLCGMNLTALIRMMDGHNVEIRKVRSGEKLDLSSEHVALTEAVKITVPGVMEMELAPANVDAESVESEICKVRDIMNTVLTKYQVETLDELKTLRDRIGQTQMKAKWCSEKLSDVLQGAEMDDLAARAAAVPENTRSVAEIQLAVSALCGNENLVSFRAAREKELEIFRKEYGTEDELKSRLAAVVSDLEKLAEESSSLDNIPQKYQTVSDPERCQKDLDTRAKLARETKETVLQEKSNAEGKLESYQETIQGDPEDQLAQAGRKFRESEEELRHWRHIQKVFLSRKAEVHNNPMEDIARSFAHYLSMISDGHVASEIPEGEKLQMTIYSNDYQLDYQKLSEGTKETVSLAFRLAVLDHLFPEGGGLAIFDDPFTDMDAERTRQSCELLKECALRHQIIVLTCREEYISLLGGNTIRM